MNIKDFETFGVDFHDIFEKQAKLMILYEGDLEQRMQNFDIDIYDDQELFKNFCWRISEELYEFLDDRTDIAHASEELIDSFNFLIELYVLTGYDKKLDLKQPIETSLENIDYQILNFLKHLGMTANLLKNRAWKQSHYLVDHLIFEERFLGLWPKFLTLLYSFGLSILDIEQLWSLKYQVNYFRIKSQY